MTRAFAPSSVTALFAPPDPDGDTDRSRGASLALSDGVVVAVSDSETTTVTVDGEPAPFAPVEGVLDRLGVTAAVDVRPDVPLGRGFGASGAATLATALAADRAFGLDRDRSALLDAAHEAEVAAGTGLGDVFVQDLGGLVTGGDGGPVRSVPETPVSYESRDGIATAEVLADDERMARIREAGTRALSALPAEPTVRELFSTGWEFARETELVTPAVSELVERVEAAGGVGTMAMVGETVLAVDAGGALPNESRVDAEGARVLES